MMGHTTHGLALLPRLSGSAGQRRRCSAEGEPEIVRDGGATLLLDGRRLPGPVSGAPRDRPGAGPHWATHGTVTVVIRRSHHIACLAAYLERATTAGMMILLMSSDPNIASVAPFGGTAPLMTPNPIAAGIPTTGPANPDGHQQLDHHQRLDRPPARRRRTPARAPGSSTPPAQPGHDPAVLFDDPPGTILPLGGLEAGHKGFALGLLVEALTAALGGFGRADPGEGWGAAVYLQTHRPRCLRRPRRLPPPVRLARAKPPQANPPRAPVVPPVRLPGARGLALRDKHEASEGDDPVHAGIMANLLPMGRAVRRSPCLPPAEARTSHRMNLPERSGV